MCSDPRYCPPECDLGPPSADGDSDKVSVEQLGDFWATYQPASFDVYSAGVVLMQVRRACVVYLAFDGGLPAPSSITGGRIQLAVPALREEAALVAFNQQLAAEGYELAAWKQGAGAGVAADVLDVNGGAGWALVRPTAARGPCPPLACRCDATSLAVESPQQPVGCLKAGAIPPGPISLTLSLDGRRRSCWASPRGSTESAAARKPRAAPSRGPRRRRRSATRSFKSSDALTHQLTLYLESKESRCRKTFLICGRNTIRGSQFTLYSPRCGSTEVNW